METMIGGCAEDLAVIQAVALDMNPAKPSAKPRHRPKRQPKPLCNCPATRELYAKAFPHRAGNVHGCHMGADGRARDGIARPGCHCRACEVTNTDMQHAGYGRQDGHLEHFAGRDWRHWQRDLADWEETQTERVS